MAEIAHELDAMERRASEVDEYGGGGGGGGGRARARCGGGGGRACGGGRGGLDAVQQRPPLELVEEDLLGRAA